MYLNYLYNAIVTTYPELKENIKNTQRSWIKARDSICAYMSLMVRNYRFIKTHACTNRHMNAIEN
ncbi:lysozyme inhibitor LprI family protein [Klebsiella quasipneumoniae]